MSDQRLNVCFYKRRVRDDYWTQAKGYDIWRDDDHVEIRLPGESLNVIDRPVQAEDKLRFPRQWRAFLEGHSQEAEGEAVETLFAAGSPVPNALRSKGVCTVEQLANLSATGMDAVGMGSQDYVNRAKDWLAAQGETKIAAALAERDAQIEDLKTQVEQMSQQLAAILRVCSTEAAE